MSASRAAARSPRSGFVRADIAAMSGYTPGEQPKIAQLIKLNTNENPFPLSPAVMETLRNFPADKLRRYPDPNCDELRRHIAEEEGLSMENVLIGNGSDDILTIAVRTFVDAGGSLCFPDPTYSLYPILAKLQGAATLEIPLEEDFSLPADFAARAKGADLVIIARPNAPTGNAFPIAQMEAICGECLTNRQAILIDEAYVDFADDNCASFVKKFPNAIIARTMSKSYSMAGGRVGWALADAALIGEMMKLKDSYNVNALSQAVALAALRDKDNFRRNTETIRRRRDALTREFQDMGFKVLPSMSNFLFVSPPGGDAARLFRELRERRIVTRYFSAPRIAAYLRISIGTDEELRVLTDTCRTLLSA